MPFALKRVIGRETSVKPRSSSHPPGYQGSLRSADRKLDRNRPKSDERRDLQLNPGPTAGSQATGAGHPVMFSLC